MFFIYLILLKVKTENVKKPRALNFGKTKTAGNGEKPGEFQTVFQKRGITDKECFEREFMLGAELAFKPSCSRAE